MHYYKLLASVMAETSSHSQQLQFLDTKDDNHESGLMVACVRGHLNLVPPPQTRR